MQVHVEEIDKLIERIQKFNSLDIREVQLIQGGVPLAIPKEKIEEWLYIGLSNKDFVSMRYWEED